MTNGVAVGLAVGCASAAALAVWKARRTLGSLRRVTHEADRRAAVLRAQIDQLTAERNQAAAVVQSMTEGVFAVDREGRVLLINPAAERLLEVAVSHVVGRSLFETIRHHDIQELVREWLRHGTTVTKEVTWFHPRERKIRVHRMPCQDCGTTGACMVVVLQDVTEHYRYEQLRKEFVANVSHELKSPLTSIRGLTETLLTGALDDPANNRRFVQLLDEEAARLSRLIDDLLPLSQAIPLNWSTVALQPFVESLLVSFRPGIKARRLAVTLQLPDGLAVNADPDRLRQVLSNLLDNAIKYNTDGGSITLSASRDGAWANVAVADTGIGIPEHALPRIFERFYRVDKARSRELGGTGLGLSIVKHIVEAHGGRVSVESRTQQGSTFFLTIPLAS